MTQPPPSQVPPVYRDPRGLPPPYPPGQEPIPPRRPRRSTPILAPVLALIGLVLVAGVSLAAMNFLDATIGDTAAADPSPTPVVTATDDPAASEPPDGTVVEDTPEPVVEVTAPPIVEPPTDERADITGTILFTRAGDVWSASGTSLSRVTNSESEKSDSSPAWSPDGKHIYFIRSTKRVTSNSRPGGKYTLYPTDLMRMKADGSDRKKIYEALIKDSRGLWFSHVRQPSVSPSGATVAVVSDGPDGSADEVTLHVINSKTGRLRKVATATEPKLGHNNPAFSPDGTKIAFTYNDNAGTNGRPKIAIYTCQTKANCSLGKVKYLKPGYANPSWSPDGKLLAVESTTGTGRDIAIITARRGDVRVELTQDGDSFAPVFSPDGDQIAYLHRDGLDIDLRVMTLDIDDRGKITLIDDRPVTSDGRIDGESTPSWFIPSDELTDVVPEASASGEPVPTEEPAEPATNASDEAPPPPPGS
ncbi:MAG: hypothetical protein U9O18_04960 [Chloroflexota bacterium]|nr:hypothetical protein [Chloroflexota bacterium]